MQKNKTPVGLHEDTRSDDRDNRLKVDLLPQVQASVHTWQESDSDSLASDEVSQRARRLSKDTKIVIRKQILKYLKENSSRYSLFGDDMQSEQASDRNLSQFNQSQSSLEGEYNKMPNDIKLLAKATVFRYVDNAKRAIIAEHDNEYLENISLQPFDHIDSMNANADWEIKSKSVDVYHNLHLFFDKATSINSYVHQSVERAVEVVTSFISICWILNYLL